MNPPADTWLVRGAKLSDLSLRRFEEDYLPVAFARALPAHADRSVEEWLVGAKMIRSVEDPTPTTLGLLVLGNEPQDHLGGAYIQFLRFAGTGLADDVVDEMRCTGPIARQFERLFDKLHAHNRTDVDFTSGRVEKRSFTYAMPALKQIVYNAVLHRAYEGTNAPVRICWFNDRIEIISPGGPHGAVTADNFGQPGVADYRNPNLAEAMRVLRLAQLSGNGIEFARDALRRNKQPGPAFKVEPTWVHCTLKPRPHTPRKRCRS